MATKKPIYAKARPKRLGKPKSFKNIFISQAIKKYKPKKKK